MRFVAHTFAAILSLSVAFAHAAGPTGLLNDTGQTSCYDASSAAVACSASGVGSDAGAIPRQDARFGRDAKAAAGTLTKTGGGVVGFDFSCVLWNGTVDNSAACVTALTANAGGAATGTPSTDWACTKDNVTNLIWSLQSFDYISWTEATATGAGSPIKAHNDATRCGFSDGWRVPTRRELRSIVNFGANSPAIDGAYFPSTSSWKYWSNDVYIADASFAWYVLFDSGEAYANYTVMTSGYFVRLVRSGP